MAISAVTSTRSNSQDRHKKGFSSLPNQLLRHTIGFAGIQSFFSMQAIDKHTHTAAKRALKQFTDPMELESDACSRLLTDVYHTTLAKEQNVAEVLKNVSTVAIRKGAFILKSSWKNPSSEYTSYEYTCYTQTGTCILKNSSQTHLYGYAHPKILAKFKENLLKDNLLKKFCNARFFMHQVIKSLPQVCWKISLNTDLLHGFDFNTFSDRNFKHGGKLYESRCIIRLDETNSTTFIIHGLPEWNFHPYYVNQLDPKIFFLEGVLPAFETGKKLANITLSSLKENEAIQRDGAPAPSILQSTLARLMHEAKSTLQSPLYELMYETILWNSAKKRGMKLPMNNNNIKGHHDFISDKEPSEAPQKGVCILQ